MSKIIDCVTFFQENLQMELRFSILKNIVDKFVVCESIYDHRGRTKTINFSKDDYPEVKDKIEHIILTKKFPIENTPWQNQATQREYIFTALANTNDDDYIMFSDSDEIPNPKLLKNLSLKNKFAIFMQKFFVYKLNVFNKYESPWEGTRACKKKDLKSVNFLRKKILKKNLNKPFWKFSLEKNIQIINDGGWHFNNLYSPYKISKKLQTFQHSEFEAKEFSSVDLIKSKIEKLEDLFGRNHKYEKVVINNEYPEYILNNLDLFKEHIL